MNFQQCRYVEVVARVGSFSQAAKELYMTQPNLSCSIKDLENEFGDQFVRIHRNALVAVHFLDGLELISSGQYQVRCRGLEERLAVSRRHLPNLRERIQKI